MKEEVGRGAACDCPTSSNLAKEEETCGVHSSSSTFTGSELPGEFSNVEELIKINSGGCTFLCKVFKG
jgi:hypothetical protein